MKCINSVKQNNSIDTYDRPIAFQPVMCPIRVEMCDNICSNRLDNRFEASNRDLCYMFSIPKMFRPMAPLDICVGLDQEWLQIEKLIPKNKTKQK